jgi:hypothetical protein
LRNGQRGVRQRRFRKHTICDDEDVVALERPTAAAAAG